MYILDTDHLTILQRGGQLAEKLKSKNHCLPRKD